MMNLRQALIGAASLIALTVPAVAAETVKIAFIDPLSGGAAPPGENRPQDATSSSPRVPTRKAAAARSSRSWASTTRSIRRNRLIAAQEGDRPGHPLHHAGQRLLGRRRAHRRGRTSTTSATPARKCVYLNYAAVDPALTNEKCSFWHFRFDADSDMKMEALTNFMKGAPEHQEGLPDQPGLLVRPGGRAAAPQDARRASGPTSRSSATSCTRCRRSTTSRPTSPRSRRPAPTRVITGNWGQDLALLIKAAADAGLQVELVHLLRRRHRRADRDRQTGVDRSQVFQIARRHRQHRA